MGDVSNVGEMYAILGRCGYEMWAIYGRCVQYRAYMSNISQ